MSSAHPDIPKRYGKALWMALVITVLTLVLGYPLAFYMAHSDSTSRAQCP